MMLFTKEKNLLSNKFYFYLMIKYTKITINSISKYKLLNIFLLIFSLFINNVSASELDNLFFKLKNASDKNIAKHYENRIWNHWLLDGSKDTRNIQMQRGVNLLQSGELNNALKIFESLSKKEPRWAEPINKIATIKFLMGDYLGSVNDIKLTLQIEPRHFGAISGLVQINMHLQNFNEALRNLDYVLKIHPYIGIKTLRPTILRLLKKSSI